MSLLFDLRCETVFALYLPLILRTISQVDLELFYPPPMRRPRFHRGLIKRKSNPIEKSDYTLMLYISPAFVRSRTSHPADQRPAGHKTELGSHFRGQESVDTNCAIYNRSPTSCILYLSDLPIFIFWFISIVTASSSLQ